MPLEPDGRILRRKGEMASNGKNGSAAGTTAPARLDFSVKFLDHLAKVVFANLDDPQFPLGVLR
jgi:hypothetical protein